MSCLVTGATGPSAPRAQGEVRTRRTLLAARRPSQPWRTTLLPRYVLTRVARAVLIDRQPPGAVVLDQDPGRADRLLGRYFCLAGLKHPADGHQCDSVRAKRLDLERRSGDAGALVRAGVPGLHELADLVATLLVHTRQD